MLRDWVDTRAAGEATREELREAFFVLFRGLCSAGVIGFLVRRIKALIAITLTLFYYYLVITAIRSCIWSLRRHKFIRRATTLRQYLGTILRVY